MAEDIGRICQESVEENAAKYDGLPFEDVVEKLVDIARRDLAREGWINADSEYGVNVEGIVRNFLSQLREIS